MVVWLCNIVVLRWYDDVVLLWCINSGVMVNFSSNVVMYSVEV